MLIPQGPVKTTTDVTAFGGAILGYFKAIPWPEVAACLAAVYTLIRIVETLYDRFKTK